MLRFWKKSDAALEERTRLYREEGMRSADQLIDRVKGAFLRECFLDPELAKFAADGGAKLKLSFELQFLWGFFHEHVQTADLPVNGYDRIKLHLIDRLGAVHGYDIKRAVAEANAVEDLFNSDEPLFTSIAKLGQLSYKTPFEKSMAVAYRAMMTGAPMPDTEETDRPPMPDTDETDRPPFSMGVREQAALVGLLAERQVLIENGSLYVVFSKSPVDAWGVLQIDCGIMLIALTKRLGGDAVAAEHALREAIWIHMLNHRVDLTGKAPGDVDLGVANAVLERWQKNPNDWFAGVVWSAYSVLHGAAADDLSRHEGTEMYGRIGGDAWRLYASTLTALGEQCSRHWPGDDRGY